MTVIAEADIQAMITNAVDILEKHREYADDTAKGDGELDVLEQSARGEYAPSAVTAAAASFRAGLSSLIDQSQVLAFFEPVVYEYAKWISDNFTTNTAPPTGSSDLRVLMRAIYESMHNRSKLVESREIAHGVTATDTSNSFGSTIVGTGAIHRTIVDDLAYEIENCAVERKLFRCIRDQVTGTKEEAEEFAVFGEAPSQDNLGRNMAAVTGQLGTGNLGTIRSLHAGSGAGGSLLRNSSFSTYSATATPRFSGWDLDNGTASLVTQDTVNYYRDYPGSSTSASCKLDQGTAETKTLSQSLSNMRISQIDLNVPYFCRVMIKNNGSAVGGNLVLRCGAVSETIAVSGIGTDWYELKIGTTTAKDVWAKNFIQDDFDIEFEWNTATSGTLVIDDFIFAPMTQIDSTWWAIRQTHATAPVPWKVDDTIEFVDTGGDSATYGKINYWLYRAGLGFLPHTTGTQTWSDP